MTVLAGQRVDGYRQDACSLVATSLHPTVLHSGVAHCCRPLVVIVDTGRHDLANEEGVGSKVD
jgi:hypothetical protein